ncbi:OFA family MFS transporter [Coralloluteibacterium stylophorae]|uniref:OFA family MFS transporter n=1 Tax=Coralloluteibacterium stylophorae TaxID=1776034 RepID=A0AAP2C9S4_9GAMM|nr:OFA family MFS transporter [Coralloluteibacterium stylophorae]MBS7456231.1 OFA family MFS transporter [Coralloluteibacterium stylophorae]
MASVIEVEGRPDRGFGLLAKERIVAGPGFNRWLVPPAALAIHLCIGMAYGFSVFWLPLSKALGIGAPIACPDGTGLLAQLTTTSCDWTVSALGVMYTLFFVFLGCSAALWGGWLEKVGPRKAGVVAAVCWAGGLAISAFGIYVHQLWLMWLGSGVIGGIGLGLGYISPVSTLIKWFPDRRGMATGMAIMGFGGGAMIGAPLADRLMTHFADATQVGAWQTFLVLAVVYFVFMMGGALGYRIPASEWKPAGWTPPPATGRNAMITSNHVHVRQAIRTPQFWLIWLVLCMNVSAGIGVLGMASPMLQEMFGGRLIGSDAGFADLDTGQLARIAAIAAGFTGLLSLFNIVGRFFWASVSDRIGRRMTYATFFVLGIALYASAPHLGAIGSVGVFVAAFCIIVSMYGGGFATVPAYLADIFGTRMVGAIHGWLLTAWATAGIVGPLVVNGLRDWQLAQGIPRAQVYDQTMYILAGLLLVGFVCNLLVRPVHAKHHMTEQQLRETAPPASAMPKDDLGAALPAGGAAVAMPAATVSPALVALAWAAVGIPLLIGVWITLEKALVLFR